MVIKKKGITREFDFFIDEDVRSRRIGILCLAKELSPALNQALFRVRENQCSFHAKKIEQNEGLSANDKTARINEIGKQMREVKWSNLNLIRSFIAQGFIQQFFHYWGKGPLPIMFFNAPFIDDHANSVDNFFQHVNAMKVEGLQTIEQSSSVLFMDSLNTPMGYKLEEKIRTNNNLSRCYRIDSRASDLIQLTDILLGITTSIKEKKHTNNKGKLLLVNEYRNCTKRYKQKYAHICDSVHVL